MNRHHTGSGRRRVIPHDWREHHAGVIASTLESAVTIPDPRPATSEWNEETGQTETTARDPLFSGPAKITAVTSPPGGPADAADEQVPHRIYEIVLELEVEAALPGLTIHVDESPDPMLTGKDLHVDHVDRGDNRFSRILLATLAH